MSRCAAARAAARARTGAGASPATSSNSKRRSRPVISKTRWTGPGPGHERQPEARLPQPLVGGHERAQARGVDEVEPAQVHDDALGGLGLRVAQRGLELLRAPQIQLPQQPQVDRSGPLEPTLTSSVAIAAHHNRPA